MITCGAKVCLNKSSLLLAEVALAIGPGDPEDLVGHCALELGHGNSAGVHVATPEVIGEAMQDAVRVL